MSEINIDSKNPIAIHKKDEILRSFFNKQIDNDRIADDNKKFMSKIYCWINICKNLKIDKRIRNTKTIIIDIQNSEKKLDYDVISLLGSFIGKYKNKIKLSNLVS